jgi:cell division protein FtsZ
MSQKQPATESAHKKFRLKFLGLGGAGCNTVSHIAKAEMLDGVELVAINTDAQALDDISVPERIQIGTALTHGLGAGGDSEIGMRAAQQDAERLEAVVQGADVVYLTAGLGGGTGGGAMPAVAKVAHDQNALVLAFVSLPFSFEGERRRQQALAQLEQLKAQADAVICIPNDKLFKIVGENATAVEAFRKCDEIIATGAQAIWQLMSRKGLINLDFADLRATLGAKHCEGLFAHGEAEGENRAKNAIKALLESPMFDAGQALARTEGVLVSILGGPDLSLTDVQRTLDAISREAPRAHVIMGAAIEPSYKSKFAVTVIASTNLTPRKVVAPALAKPAAVTQAAPEPLRPLPTPTAPAAETPTKKKVVAKAKQETLPLDHVTRGRFEKSEPTLWDGENLDVPTFLRRGIALSR